jgi:hypothetical protein
MRKLPEFHTDTPLATGLKALFRQLEQHLAQEEPIDAYLAGGIAVYGCKYYFISFRNSGSGALAAKCIG